VLTEACPRKTADSLALVLVDERDNHEEMVELQAA
jgi:hypothetical protein